MFRENSFINGGHITLLYVCIAGLYRNITIFPENKKETLLLARYFQHFFKYIQIFYLLNFKMAGIIDKWRGFFTNGGSSDLPFNGNVVIICRGRWEARISIHKYRSFHSSPQGSLPNHIYTQDVQENYDRLKIDSEHSWIGQYFWLKNGKYPFFRQSQVFLEHPLLVRDRTRRGGKKYKNLEFLLKSLVFS